MRFAESARQLAGQAGLLLGWRPDDFWAATPEDLGLALSALRGDEEPAADTAMLAQLKEQFPDG
ncbi:MAG: phage tail assembly chaperone [Sphingopyxis sp.]